MNKTKRKALTIALSLIIATFFTACSGGSKTSSENGNTDKPDILAVYKKVNLGMTKEQVDKTLGLEGKAETSQYAIKGTYNYTDEATGNGVSIVYNDSNIVFAKTASYGSNKELAPLTKAPVKEEQKEKITDEMAYSDVIKILGGEGIEVNVTGKEKDPTNVVGIMRRWVNSDGSGFQIVFSKDEKAGNVLYFDHE